MKPKLSEEERKARNRLCCKNWLDKGDNRKKRKEQLKNWNKQWYLANKERLKEEHRQRYYSDNGYREKILHGDRKRGIIARELVLEHYGKSTCACCGEKHKEFLAIDHANGGGNKHRKEIGISSGRGFYRWLVRNNYPDGFRVLCNNCNQSLGNYGYCPHEKEK